jgi:serine phosphatase RsbU (regulator of sigma subunit)
MRLLLVEDDEGDAVLVEEVLSGAVPPPHLIRGHTLEDGLARLDSDVDCVLLDLGLPDATGLETLSRVRAAAPETAIIVLTGRADEATGVAAVNAGAQDYLVKGRVDQGSLTRAIRYAVGRRQADNARRRLEIVEVQARENARLERGLLPKPIIEDPTIRVASLSRPGRRRALLGGDFYDVVQTEDGVVHAIIGDVCGQGPDEAAIGVCLRSAWRALVLSGCDGEVVLQTLDRILTHERHVDLLFATVCAVQIEPARDVLRMQRAGHLPPLLIGEGSVEVLPRGTGGRPLGLDATGWPELEVRLPPGWSLLLYTDGLIEGRVDGGGQLGEERLRDLVAERMAFAGGDADGGQSALVELVEHVEARAGGALRDDVAVLLLSSRPDEQGDM